MLTLAMLLIAVLVVLGIAGPRVQKDTRFTVPDLPEDLDGYLNDLESGCDDLTPGAEKTIFWKHKDKRKTHYAFIYLHGFSACRQESEPVPSDIAAYFGGNIYYARLAGNGRSDDSLAEGSVNRWVNDASEALTIADRIGQQTIIIACSTGATIAWWIAQQDQFKKQIEAMVFFSPNFGVYDKKARFLLWPWGEQLAHATTGRYRSSEPATEQQAKFWTNRYPVKALLPLMAMVSLANKYPPSANTIPIYILYSNLDKTVDAQCTKAFYTKLESKKKSLLIDNQRATSKHILVGDIMAPQNNATVTRSVIEFLEDIGLKADPDTRQ